MPRVIRKSSSRCSIRNSCRKRYSPRDNVHPHSIREALRSSSCTPRYSPFRRENRMLTPSPPLTIPTIVASSKASRETEPPKVNQPPENPKGLIEHGIRFIMLPLHLFQLCVWGSPTAAPKRTEEKKASPSKIEKHGKKSPQCPENKNSTSSRASSSSGFSSCSSTFSRSARNSSIDSLPPIPSSTSSSDIPPLNSDSKSTKKQLSSPISVKSTNSKPTEQKSPSVSKILPEKSLPKVEITDDESSDEMVTADEYFDESSNDQWCTSGSYASMNMSIDLEGFNHSSDKLPSNLNANYRLEEPMDVSIEESNFNSKQQTICKSPSSKTRRVNQSKNNVGKAPETGSSSSSSSATESLNSMDRENYSSSSVDREIASIFQRACTSSSPSSSSSSDEEYRQQPNGRRNNPFVNRPSNVGFLRSGSRLREEICDANIRKKRTPCQYEASGETHDPTTSEQVHPAKRSDRGTSGNRRNGQTLNPIDLSVIKGSKGNNLQETCSKVVDTIPINQADSAYSDEDVEMNSIYETVSNLQSISMSMQESVIEWMDQDLDYVADNEDSNDGSSSPQRSRIPSTNSTASTTSLNVDKNSPKAEKRSTQVKSDRNRENQVSELETSMIPHEIPRRGPPGFPEVPQNSPGSLCNCGNPKCFVIPVAVPANSSAMTSWLTNYPRAPSPLRHLYYEYPEFMTPPAEAADTIGKSSPYVLIPCPTNL